MIPNVFSIEEVSKTIKGKVVTWNNGTIDCTINTVEGVREALSNNIIPGSIILFKASATYVDLRKLIPLLRQ